MNRTKNPYPEFLVDEASGIKVHDSRHRIWAEGYEAGQNDRPSISSAIKADGIALVFNARGEQITEYQGLYAEVRAHLLRDAPPDAVFYTLDRGKLEAVPRDNW